jgi:hypothetical protein
MEKLIACCGINCVTCDARIATVNNDNELRTATALKWREQFNAPNITAEMINCTGCRVEGVKFSHCEQCEIRKCVKSKGFNTCGNCAEMDNCMIVSFVLQHVPEAISNLKSLN